MSIHLGAPQIIYLAVNIIALAILAGGSSKAGAVAGILIWCCFTLPILYWGGFFG